MINSVSRGLCDFAEILRVSAARTSFLSETGSHYVTLADLELKYAN